MTFLMIASFAESLTGFRAPLIAALQHKCQQVHVAAPDLPAGHPVRIQLEAQGLVVHEIPMLRTGTRISQDLRTLMALYGLMRKVRPTHVMGYTIKPVIYGTLAAWLARVPHRFALITGLGYAFQKEAAGGLQALVHRLYALALRRVKKAFFQNPDDEALFREREILAPLVPSCIVNGSGVDVGTFEVARFPSDGLCFMLIARFLGAKGLREYAEAARRIRRHRSDVRFQLVGWIDSNPDAIAQSELDEWVAEGAVEYLGKLADVRPAISGCHVYVLPSYREGTPRTVLEAMAMGRPVITTDAPGCRETVVDGVNGFLVEVKSVDDLERAMLRFVEDRSLVEAMGKCSREIAENKYDVRKVNAVMLAEMGIR